MEEEKEKKEEESLVERMSNGELLLNTREKGGKKFLQLGFMDGVSAVARMKGTTSLVVVVNWKDEITALGILEKAKSEVMAAISLELMEKARSNAIRQKIASA